MVSIGEHAEMVNEEARYRLIIDAITDYAIFMLDTEGRVASWNPGAHRLKGYEANEIIGRHFSCFYPPEDVARGVPAQVLARSLTEGRLEHEGWRIRKDGTRFWAHVIVDPVFTPDGQHVGFAKVTRDLTERRETQMALDRTREQLLQAQKMEAIGQLTGGIAHDFNNLLTAILSSLELVRKRLPGDPTLNRLIDNAMQGAQRGATLTQRMLAFARRQPLKPEPVEIPQLVESLAELVQASLGPSTRISMRFPAELPPVTTDPSQLETAVLNLCVNARDAMPQGGTISITAARHVLGENNDPGLPAGAYVCLAVRDMGEGMDEATLTHATEPFFTTKGVGKGSGLGLPMVHGLAAQSGGRLVLKSRKGEGTTAEVWLPVASAPAQQRRPAEPSARAADEKQTLTVLAVDDDPLVLMNTVMMLEDLGHHVHQASSGAAALEILESGESVDAIISDHAMPGMTGSQLAAIIRTKWPDVPILLATGYAELPPGGDNGLPRLSKPFSQRSLAEAISGVLADAEGGQ